jgi:hypothetical protein
MLASPHVENLGQRVQCNSEVTPGDRATLNLHLTLLNPSAECMCHVL